MECIEKMQVFIRGKAMDFTLRKEDLPTLYLNYRGVKEKGIWVEMSVGTLVTNEGRMFGCIEEKLLDSYLLIWDHDHLLAGSIVLL